MELTKLIRVYDHVFEEDFCKSLSEKVQSVDLNQIVYSKNPGDTYNCHAAIQSNLTTKFYDGIQNGDVENTNIFVFRQVERAVRHYIHNCGYKFPFHPSKYTYEAITLSRYLNNDHDEYGLHSASDCICSSSKTLMIIGLLSNVEEGGEICFPDLNLDVKLDMGSILIFPSNWMFPFKVNKPVSGVQHMFHTFTHFADHCNQPDICLHHVHKKTD